MKAGEPETNDFSPKQELSQFMFYIMLVTNFECFLV